MCLLISTFKDKLFEVPVGVGNGRVPTSQIWYQNMNIFSSFQQTSGCKTRSRNQMNLRSDVVASAVIRLLINQRIWRSLGFLPLAAGQKRGKRVLFFCVSIRCTGPRSLPHSLFAAGHVFPLETRALNSKPTKHGELWQVEQPRLLWDRQAPAAAGISTFL